jgi:hypothetical protein
MSLKPPPFKAQPINQMGFFNNIWSGFFDGIHSILNNSTPWKLTSYTVLTAPDATLYEGNIIYVSDEIGGATVAFSDGTNWRRVQDRVIIS